MQCMALPHCSAARRDFKDPVIPRGALPHPPRTCMAHAGGTGTVASSTLCTLFAVSGTVSGTVRPRATSGCSRPTRMRGKLADHGQMAHVRAGAVRRGAGQSTRAGVLLWTRPQTPSLQRQRGQKCPPRRGRGFYRPLCRRWSPSATLRHWMRTSHRRLRLCCATWPARCTCWDSTVTPWWTGRHWSQNNRMPPRRLKPPPRRLKRPRGRVRGPPGQTACTAQNSTARSMRSGPGNSSDGRGLFAWHAKRSCGPSRPCCASPRRRLERSLSAACVCPRRSRCLTGWCCRVGRRRVPA